MRLLILVAFLGAVPAIAGADDYAGRYGAATPEGQVELVLERTGAGRYAGVLSIGEYPMEVVGAVRGNRLHGEINDDGDSYGFKASKEGSALRVAFDDDDYIVLSALTDETGPAPQRLSVNGVALSADEVRALRRYGVQAQPGDYWYDPACGAWGVWGGPTAGFIQAGIPVAPLPAHASGGRTNVFVNGRNIAWTELTYLQSLAGGAIPPGYYWLDGSGSSGWSSSDGQSGGVWISNPYGGTGTTVTY